jgi:hypothetical protein
VHLQQAVQVVEAHKQEHREHQVVEVKVETAAAIGLEAAEAVASVELAEPVVLRHQLQAQAEPEVGQVELEAAVVAGAVATSGYQPAVAVAAVTRAATVAIVHHHVVQPVAAVVAAVAITPVQEW